LFSQVSDVVEVESEVYVFHFGFELGEVVFAEVEDDGFAVFRQGVFDAFEDFFGFDAVVEHERGECCQYPG